MKIFLLIVFISIWTNFSYAQNSKFFLDKDDQITDSVKAKSYMILYERKLTDTVYYMKQFSLENLLMVEGSFKDEALSVPHGIYSYYIIHRETKNGSFSKANNYQDTSYHKPLSHYLDARGLFINGKMNGEWLHFFSNGDVKRVETFKDEVLDGTYREFWGNAKMMLSGNYKNNKREGVWLQDGGLYEVTYKEGKSESKKLNKDIQSQQEKEKKELDKKLKEASKYDVQARPKGDFRSELRNFMSFNNYNSIINEEAKVRFIVKEDGKISEPTVTGLSDMTLVSKIKEFFLTANSWYPGTTGIDKKPVVNFVVYSLRYL